MRCLDRNKSGFWYCTLLNGAAEIVDENGNRTGEKLPVYNEAVHIEANVSPASGYAQNEQFGDLTDYDHVIVTDDINCPITESTVLFLEKQPEYATDSVTVLPEREALLGEQEPTAVVYSVPLYDYIVRRVSKSLNSVSIAVRKAKVS